MDRLLLLKSLANKSSGGGLSEKVRTAIITLFENATYSADMSSTIETLKEEFENRAESGDNPTEPNKPDTPVAPEGNIKLTYELEGCSLSNQQPSIVEGGEYNTTIMAENNKHLGLVYVETGGTDITKDVYDTETDSINIKAVTKDTYVEVICPDAQPDKTVDLVLFSGQSNMSGRGNGDEATECPVGEGYWYKDGALGQITGFFGNEGSSSGSMVSSVAKAYYDSCGVPIVGVSSSYGGMVISSFAPGSTTHDKSVRLFNEAKTYLEANGYTIRNKAMVWCQGESDADETTQTDYENAFKAIRDDFVASCGMDSFFIVEIGQYGYDGVSFDVIQAAQENLAATEENIILASKKFVGAKSLMRDAWHYVQAAYNIVGRDTGIHMAYHYVTGKTPRVTEFMASDVTDQNVGVVEELDTSAWNYTVYEDEGTIGLYQYIGTETDVVVRSKYQLNGMVYNTLIDRIKVDGAWTGGLFAGKTMIETVAFEDGVAFAQNGGTSANIADRMFEGCTALQRVDNVPDMGEGGSSSTRSAVSMYSGCSAITYAPIPKNAISIKEICKGCSSLTKLADTRGIPENAENMYGAFQNSAIECLPDIPSTVTNLQNVCSGTSGKLKSVGVIGSGVTNMNGSFRYQTNLTGVIRIESPNVANMNQTVDTKALPNVTFEVPADSTTYATLVAALPDAVVTTF